MAARCRLLEEHADALEGFLPKGTFEHQDEVNEWIDIAHRYGELFLTPGCVI